MGKKREEVCMIDDLDDSPYWPIPRPYSISQLVYDQTEGGCFMFFVKWRDIQLCCDYMNGWAFADVTKVAVPRCENSMWELITPPFDSLDDALDYPILDGKSIRERWDELYLYGD